MSDIPMSDISLRVASGLDTKDEVYFLKSLGVILVQFPQITVDDYWRLTCAEHAALMLVADPKGRVARGD